MKYLEFLDSFIKSVGLTVKNGFVYTGTTQVSVNGKPFVLPYNDVVEDMFEPSDSGVFEPRYEIFNPLNENLIKKDSVATIYLKKTMESTLNRKLYIVNLLLIEGYRQNLKNLKPLVTDFYILSENAKTGRTKLFDDEFMKIYDKKIKDVIFTDRSCSLATITLKKAVKVDGEMYYRGFVLDNPLDKNVDKCSFAKRKVDKNLLRIVATYAFGKITHNESCIAYSKNDISYTFMTMVKGWLKIATELNKFADALQEVDKDVANMVRVSIGYTVDDLEFEKYEAEALKLPSETENGVVPSDEEPTVTTPEEHGVTENELDRDKLLSSIFDTADEQIKNVQTPKRPSHDNAVVDVGKPKEYVEKQFEPVHIPQPTMQQPVQQFDMYGQPIQQGYQQPYGQPVYEQPYEQPIQNTGGPKPYRSKINQQKNGYNQPYGNQPVQQSYPRMDPRQMRVDNMTGLLIDQPARLLYDPNKGVHVNPQTRQIVILPKPNPNTPPF